MKSDIIYKIITVYITGNQNGIFINRIFISVSAAKPSAAAHYAEHPRQELDHAAVFPVPVCACPIKSRPSSITGIARF